jgi:phage tail sheath protein FI
MPQYFSPGVYVEEVPSAVQPIAGVSTSTAAFIGIVPDTIQIPIDSPNWPSTTWTFPFPALPNPLPDDAGPAFAPLTAAKKSLDALPGKDDKSSEADKNRTKSLAQKKVAQISAQAVAFQAAGTMADAGVPILCTSFTDFKRNFGSFSTDSLVVSPASGFTSISDAEAVEKPAVPLDPKTFNTQNWLAHAVFGFFDNGGTRAWVMRATSLEEIRDPEFLDPLEAIEEISLVLAPGILDAGVQGNLIDYCERLSTCFAILDAPVLSEDANVDSGSIRANVTDSDYAALYFPWIKVFDPAFQILNPDSDGEILCPPSGHVAGIYSRVDHLRGVFKAPANEVVRGARELEMHISRSQQDGLNPDGVNCIRFINGAYKVWGARTIGGDANNDLKYINVRRTLIFLRESIDKGTQWAVFEPNDRSLWAKITRNITAFLTTVWADGALFGSSPQEAFYVKCDDETNPPEERDLGKVTTEIGVAIVRPAEFVIFRISQWESTVVS